MDAHIHHGNDIFQKPQSIHLYHMGVYMLRQPVSSSNLLSVGYDSSSSILEIAFHSGGVYQYYNVPQSIYIALLNAPSKGKYFHHYIKKIYRYRKV